MPDMAHSICLIKLHETTTRKRFRFFVSDYLKDVRGWQFLTIEAAEALCMFCLPPEEHIFIKDIWVTTFQKVIFCKGLTIKFVILRIF